MLIRRSLVPAVGSTNQLTAVRPGNKLPATGFRRAKLDASGLMFLTENTVNEFTPLSTPAMKVGCTFRKTRERVGPESVLNHASLAAVGILVKCAATRRTLTSFTFP